MTTCRRFLRFNAVGALGVAVQLSVVWLLTTVLSVPGVVATTIGVAAAVGHNFLWHRRWTWADRIANRSALPAALSFAKFVLTNATVSILGNVIVTVAAAVTLGVGPLLANAIGIVLCGLVNYRTSDRMVFANPLERRVQLRQHFRLRVPETVIASVDFKQPPERSVRPHQSS